MKRKTLMTITIVIMAALLVLLVVLKVTDSIEINSGVRLSFVGSSTSHTYKASYLEVRGKFTHTLKPSKDSDTLHCYITTEKGSVHVTITQKADGTVPLDKEISENVEFDLKATGKVKIILETSSHSGSYLFEY